MSSSLVLRGDHLEHLRALVLPPGGAEGAALMLVAPVQIGHEPWEGEPVARYLSQAVLPIAPEDLVSAGGDHVTTSTRSFARALRQAAEEGLTAAFVHSHPGGPAVFSKQDDRGEAELARMASNRNGPAARVLSLLVTEKGALAGRVWSHPHGAVPLERILAVGDRIAVHQPPGTASAAPEAFHRQGLAFGDDLYRAIASLRIGVVGCGATGSATAMLLGRLGARRVALFDPDRVEDTNLNRLHGATMEHARAGAMKVETVKDMVEGFGLGAEVVVVREWIGSDIARDVLKSCDVVFGCTDDHEGRSLLNRLAYVYSVPVIDMGIRIDPRGPGQPVRGAVGRVTTLAAGARCLLCRGVIDTRRAREEQIERTDPEEYIRQREQGYIVGQVAPNPAVVHFTTDVACMAVDELVHRLTGYRPAGAVAHRVRHFHALEDRQPGAASPGVCRVCQDDSNWGMGDRLVPFLGRAG
jgi:hypothetical protein